MTRILLAAVVLLGVGHLGVFHAYLTDDAFISFRYLDHWLAGNGLVYNLGERVWGFTNFGWILLLAPLRALGMDPILAARGLGLLATAWIALCVGGAFAKEPTERPEANLVALLLLACNGGFLLQAWSGLETALFSALVLASLCAVHRGLATGSERQVAAAGMLAAAATLTRPEGGLVLAGLGFALWRSRRSSRMQSLRAARAVGLGYVPLVLVSVLALAFYYEAPWPNTLSAKVGASWEQLARGAHYAGAYALHYPASLVVLLAALLRWRSLGPFQQTLSVTCGAFVVLVVAAGGDWMFGYRLFHPVTTLSCAIVPGLIRGLDTRPLRAVLVLSLCIASFQLANSFTHFRISLARDETYVHSGIRIGKWMRENLPPSALLATNTAGTIPYYSGLPIVDMMGLNDRTIAERTDLPSEWKGIEKGDGRYVLARKPDFIHFASSLGNRYPMFLSDIEISLEPEFHRNYELVAMQIDPETRVLIYRRLERPRAEALSEVDWQRVRAFARKRLKESRYRY